MGRRPPRRVTAGRRLAALESGIPAPLPVEVDPAEAEWLDSAWGSTWREDVADAHTPEEAEATLGVLRWLGSLDVLTRARVCEALWRHRDDDDQGQAAAQAVLDEANAARTVEEATSRDNLR